VPVDAEEEEERNLAAQRLDFGSWKEMAEMARTQCGQLFLKWISAFEFFVKKKTEEGSVAEPAQKLICYNYVHHCMSEYTADASQGQKSELRTLAAASDLLRRGHVRAVQDLLMHRLLRFFLNEML
jgi:hypothetical protein